MLHLPVINLLCNLRISGKADSSNRRKTQVAKEHPFDKFRCCIPQPELPSFKKSCEKKVGIKKISIKKCLESNNDLETAQSQCQLTIERHYLFTGTITDKSSLNCPWITIC